MIGNLTARTNDGSTFSNRFVITMWLEPTGEAFVRSCEVIGERFRNRTSFGESAQLETAFSTRMADAVKDCLSKLSMRSEVLSLPTYAIELPHLALAGATLVATKLANGTINVMMRFLSYLGAINTAFREDIGLEVPISNASSALGAKVLGDIAAPLLNICAAIETGSSEVVGRLGDFGQMIATRSHELRFHIELLNRFVNQEAQSSDAYLASQTNPENDAYNIDHTAMPSQRLIN